MITKTTKILVPQTAAEKAGVAFGKRRAKQANGRWQVSMQAVHVASVKWMRKHCADETLADKLEAQKQFKAAAHEAYQLALDLKACDAEIMEGKVTTPAPTTEPERQPRCGTCNMAVVYVRTEKNCTVWQCLNDNCEAYGRGVKVEIKER